MNRNKKIDFVITSSNTYILNIKFEFKVYYKSNDFYLYLIMYSQILKLFLYK